VTGVIRAWVVWRAGSAHFVRDNPRRGMCWVFMGIVW
jgi:hypothetical protein